MSFKKESAGLSSEDLEREVFTRYYAKLCALLPVTVEELLPHLVTSNVISFEQEEEIFSHSMSSLKARAILVPIRKALFEGIPRPFHEFLSIMKSSQNKECAELARQICFELNITASDTEDAAREWQELIFENVYLGYWIQNSPCKKDWNAKADYCLDQSHVMHLSILSPTTPLLGKGGGMVGHEE